MLLIALLGALAGSETSAPDVAGQALSPWQRGWLEIHQLATGRGNAALVVMPDGGSLVVDVGDAGASLPFPAARPDDKAPIGAQVARYVSARLGRDQVDDLLVTHFHIDHVGGLEDFGRAVRVGRLLVRARPQTLPDRLPPALFESLRSTVAGLEARGTRVEPLLVGSAGQIALREPSAAGGPFEVRGVAADGLVWTGQGEATRAIFPPARAAADEPDENMQSAALLVRYGDFEWFTGGDLPGVPDPGEPPWFDIETPLAAGLGEVDVAVQNHHGSIDPSNANWLATLQPRVHVVPAWSPTHPSPDSLKRLMGERAYPGPRDVFVTQLREATKQTIGPRAGRVASDRGHVVVRVEPGGGRYFVVVVEEDGVRVRSVHGPYTSR